MRLATTNLTTPKMTAEQSRVTNPLSANAARELFQNEPPRNSNLNNGRLALPMAKLREMSRSGCHMYSKQGASKNLRSASRKSQISKGRNVRSRSPRTSQLWKGSMFS